MPFFVSALSISQYVADFDKQPLAGFVVIIAMFAVVTFRHITKIAGARRSGKP